IVRTLDPGMVTPALEGAASYRDKHELVLRRRAELPNAMWQSDHTMLDILLRVAQRRLIDMIRAESSRTAREEAYQRREVTAPDAASDHDDSLHLLFLCCHENLTASSAVALTLRAVGGLTTDEIGRTFLVPTSTIAQRICRAKATTASSSNGFSDTGDRDERLTRVPTVLYLISNEGYSASGGNSMDRPDLAVEAVRLTRMLHARLPENAEVMGLLALQLLHHGRREARERHGEPVPLSERDRTLWNRNLIAEGVALIQQALPPGPLDRYQVMAANSALHNEAPDDEHTDWPQILALYELAQVLDPSPMVAVSRAVAAGRVFGPRLDLTHSMRSPMTSGCGNHRVLVVQGHLLAELGDQVAAGEAFAYAARLTRSIPERRYLERRAREVAANCEAAQDA
ncbi:ECF-type sigma factor, partial [Aestuariimicrobium sp. p3-SID1156]|uniref:RNA polymerase sigma factor n=1 Tax=Aestuariimicrobium sp. p3-SID1156 TaxID=2916038 RepID=UPI00223BA7B7